ncbi:hypothetical protein WOLCODRAFT_140977 [Wolfiporia cocos MD-104 SS10]|uniref:Alcohol dehydrogenase-like C-terminal domain-containing protein n=1 Tax=Wolfiporia cocos (strain MD-104) TaxID=742152 RepID=A0A2H3JS65_WOLCO|nr:hypothetical protein WOLCODRAFT_140977 [Wolfiporia cocos MD-104 SS10]
MRAASQQYFVAVVALPADAEKLTVLKNEEGLSWSVYIDVCGMTGQTVHHAWREYSQAKPGKTVFATAGTGPVGATVIQIAKQQGLNVIACAGSEEKVAFIKSLGADVAFNYKTERTRDVLTRAGGPIDIYWTTPAGRRLRPRSTQRSAPPRPAGMRHNQRVQWREAVPREEPAAHRGQAAQAQRVHHHVAAREPPRALIRDVSADGEGGEDQVQRGRHAPVRAHGPRDRGRADGAEYGEERHHRVGRCWAGEVVVARWTRRHCAPMAFNQRQYSILLLHPVKTASSSNLIYVTLALLLGLLCCSVSLPLPRCAFQVFVGLTEYCSALGGNRHPLTVTVSGALIPDPIADKTRSLLRASCRQRALIRGTYTTLMIRLRFCAAGCQNEGSPGFHFPEGSIHMPHQTLQLTKL